MDDSEGRVIRVGIVGLSASGGWAARSHLPALAASDRYRLDGVAASTTESARRAADAYDIPRSFGSIEELANADEIDLVVIAVKVPHHAELVGPVMRAGKSVLCEWPLAPTADGAGELADEARRRGIHTAVGLQARSDPSIRYIRELVERGAIGTVLSTSVIASGMSWGDLTDTRSSYLRDSRNGATMLSIPFAHTVDALQHCLGPFSTLSALEALRVEQATNRDDHSIVRATAPDQLVVHGLLRDGAVVSIHFRGGRSAGTNFLWQIDGSDGVLVIEGPTGHLQHGNVTIRGAIDGASALAEIPVPALLDLAPEFPREDPAHAVANAYERLYSDLASAEATVPGFDDAVRLHRFLETISDSAQSGARTMIRR